jgi:hypothetical protein
VILEELRRLSGTQLFGCCNIRNFHNGGQRTIRQVVEFYNRGGDFREANVDNIEFEIGKLNLTSQQIDDLVAFLGRPLTDPHVLQQRAPFDHPQLFVPNGHLRDGGRAGRRASGKHPEHRVEMTLQ